jgi:hypothetical protein
MKKIIAGGLVLASVVLVSSCSLQPKKEIEDGMKLEGMMPKEDSKDVDAMMKKTD